MEEEFNVNKVAADVITNLSTSMAEKCWKVLCKYCKDLKNKTELDLRIAYSEYLDFSYKSINRVKTLLYKENGRPLYTFYECVGVKYENQTIAADNVENIFKIGKFIIITGTGGIGKTIMLKHFFLNCLISTDYVPVLVNVRCVNEMDVSGNSLVDIIHEEMKNYHLNLEKEYLEYSLKSGNYLFLFDGFDEINEKQDKWMEKEILKFCRRYPDNHYIMTSRPSDRFVGWNEFIELKALPLTKKQAMSMIDKLDYDKIVKNKFYKDLNDGLFDKYQSFASNPLLLIIMLITFENNAEIPDKLIDFYEQAFLTLFSKHDAHKNMYRREIKSNLRYTDFKRVFSCFCFLTYLKRRFELKEYEALEFIEKAKGLANMQNSVDASMYLDDLIHAVCMLIQYGCDLSFSHRSFQEYFTAVYISTLPDCDQEPLINRLIHKNSMGSEGIVNLLYDLQPERTIKNVIYPTMLEWRRELEEKGSYEEFLFTKVSGVIFYMNSKKGERLALRIKDIYYSSMSRFIDKAIIKSQLNLDTVATDKCKTLIEDYFLQRRVSRLEIKDLRETEIWGEFLHYLSFWTARIEGIMKFLKDYEETINSPKSKFDVYF